VLTLSVEPGRFAVCRLAADAGIPAWVESGSFWSLTRTADELSIVCDERWVPPGVQSEPGWGLLKLHGPFAFSEIGILARLTDVLARERIGVLAISTFDTDYVLVPATALDAAVRSLDLAGYSVHGAR
jgi:hypothetical protein